MHAYLFGSYLFFSAIADNDVCALFAKSIYNSFKTSFFAWNRTKNGLIE